MAVSVGFGVALDNVAIGIVIGVAIGAAIEGSLDRRGQQQDETDNGV